MNVSYDELVSVMGGGEAGRRGVNLKIQMEANGEAASQTWHTLELCAPGETTSTIK